MENEIANNTGLSTRTYSDTFTGYDTTGLVADPFLMTQLHFGIPNYLWKGLPNPKDMRIIVSRLTSV